MIHNFLAQVDLSSTQNILLTGISVLWGATTTMAIMGWRFLVKRLNVCEKDRKALWETLAFNGIRRSEPESP